MNSCTLTNMNNFCPDSRNTRGPLQSFLITATSLGLVSFSLLSICLTNVAAQDEAPLLKQRIAELEAENRALRKILTEIGNTLKEVPASSTTLKINQDGLRIIVMPGDWGESQIADIKRVAESAAHPIASLLNERRFAPIILQRSKSGPITLYKRGVGNEYQVRLDTSDRAWAQLAFQFAHEFCHIVCNYRDAKNPQIWFEETLCECASLYSLRRMGENWKTNPPYSNWKSYATALTDYANTRVNAQNAKTKSVAEFYHENKRELERSGTNRELNNFIAVKLLPLFEDSPESWHSLRYLNLGNPEENLSLEEYLEGWHQRVPERHREFILRVSKLFEVELVEIELDNAGLKK